MEDQQFKTPNKNRHKDIQPIIVGIVQQFQFKSHTSTK